jgi:hypothetical protein
MSDKGRKSKGDNVRRRSPRKQGKMFSRPFTAPRTKTVSNKKSVEERDSDIQAIEQESVTDNDSQVQLVTENKTPSPPAWLKSPEPIQTRIPGSVVIDRVRNFEIESRTKGTGKDKVSRNMSFKGVDFVPENRAQKAYLSCYIQRWRRGGMDTERVA